MFPAKEMTLDQAIDGIGLGRFQRKLLTVAGVSWAADAMEVLLIGFLIPSIIVSLQITREQAAWLVTALFVGMMLGAWFWGSVADRIGRRNVFVYTILIASIFALASALAPNYETLLLFRLLSGFGIGGSLPVDYAITAEFLPSQQRGRWLVFLESFWALGTIVAAGLAWFFIPRFPEDGWRYVLALSALPGLVAFWIRRTIPESPRYLVTQGRTAEAEQVVQIVAAANGVALPDGFRLVAPVAATASAQTRRPLAVIFQSPLLRATLILSAVWFLLSLAYYGIFTWLPGIFVQRGFDFLRTYQTTFILALAQLPGYFSAAWLVEKWGRKPTLAVYLGAAAVFTYAFAVADSLPLILGAAIMMSFFALGAWGALYAYTPEVYPTTVRATGMGWASAMARVAGIVAPLLSVRLLGLSLPVALSVYAVSFLLAALVSLLGRETAGLALTDAVGEAAGSATAARPATLER